MHSFDWVESALGVIVALSMTRIVTSTAHMFIARHKVQLDWIPFAWAVVIFFLLLQFSWNFVHLEAQVKYWSFSMFFLLLVFVFNLLIAAALILPNTASDAGVDLRAWYDLNGRWAMPFVALYALLTDPFYWYFLRLSPLQNPAAMIFIVLSTVAFFAKSRVALVSATVLSCLAVTGLSIQMMLYQ